eukprot:2415570-Pyramimonas_sp.AAC.1
MHWRRGRSIGDVGVEKIGVRGLKSPCPLLPDDVLAELPDARVGGAHPVVHLVAMRQLRLALLRVAKRLAQRRRQEPQRVRQTLQRDDQRLELKGESRRRRTTRGDGRKMRIDGVAVGIGRAAHMSGKSWSMGKG